MVCAKFLTKLRLRAAESSEPSGLRNDLPAWVKVGLCAAGAKLGDRQLAARLTGSKTVRNSQVAAYKKQLKELIELCTKVGHSSSRVCDLSLKPAKHKPLWDDVYKRIVEHVKAKKVMSKAKIRVIVREVAKDRGTPYEEVNRYISNFRRRYGITLWVSKRKLRDPPEVVEQKINQFLWFCRTVREAFPELRVEDYFNMDESPQSVSGVMDKRGGSEAVRLERENVDRRKEATQHTFLDEYHKVATFIPVFGVWPAGRRPAMMLFRHEGRPRTWEEEKKSFPEDMRVCLNASGSVDTEFMLNEFTPWWSSLEEPGRQNPRVLLMDHHTAHFPQSVNDAFEEARTIVIRIPKSLTSILQPLDVYFFGQYRTQYAERLVSIVDQITQNSTAVKRVVTTRVAQFALNACRMDSRLAFSHLGFTSDTDIKLRGMPEGWKPDLEWEPAEATKEEAQAMLDRIKVKITDIELGREEPVFDPVRLPARQPRLGMRQLAAPSWQMTMGNFLKKHRSESQNA